MLIVLKVISGVLAPAKMSPKNTNNIQFDQCILIYWIYNSISQNNVTCFEDNSIGTAIVHYILLQTIKKMLAAIIINSIQSSKHIFYCFRLAHV